MIRFSKAFLDHALNVGVTIPELFKFHPTTIRFYPLITGRGLKDVRSVFEQSETEDQELRDYYDKFIDPKGMSNVDKARVISSAVNERLSYKTDFIGWGRNEYWARPIEVHRKRFDDCDGYSVLITYLLRLYGVSADEVFTAFVWAKTPGNGSVEGWHAVTLLLDPERMMVYSVEGSWYPEKSRQYLGNTDFMKGGYYDSPLWMTNDEKTYNKSPWWRFIR